MDENLRIYRAICHETWQSGSSDAPTKTLCRNFENFDFLACRAMQKVQIWNFPLSMSLPRSANRQKSNFSKFLNFVGASDNPDCQVLWQMSRYIFRFLSIYVKFGYLLSRISSINMSKRVKPPLMPTAVSRQPFGDERQMSLFWKLEM